MSRPVLWLSLLLALALPPAAAAHADERASEPAAGAEIAVVPDQVRLALGAGVEHEFLVLEVTGPDGAPASGRPTVDPLDDEAVVAPLRGAGEGTYSVRWRVLSQDGHPSAGSFVFGVGSPPAAAPPGAPGDGDGGPLPVTARLLALTAPIVLLGLLALRLGVVGPAWEHGGVLPPGASAAEVRDAAAGPLAAAAGGWWRAWWVACGAGAVGLVLLPLALIGALDAGPAELGDLLVGTRFGTAWLVQVGALAAAAAAAAVWWRGPRAGVPAPPRWVAGIALPPALALAAIAWLGHASEGSDPELGIAIDAVHSWASAVWLGGLVGLLALLPAALRPLREPVRVRLAAGVVVRFSGLAVAAVAAVLVTGVYRALVELSSLDDLVETAYGRALLVKLVLVAALLAGGAFNRLIVHPRLERAAVGLAPDDRGAARALGVSVRAELVLAAGVMVAVAALISLPPPA